METMSEIAPNGSRRIFSLLVQTLPSFWATRILILRIFIFWMFLGPKFLAWAQLGPTHLGPAWAHPRGPGLGPPAWAHPLGPGVGPPTWAPRGPTHLGPRGPTHLAHLGPSGGPGGLGWAPQVGSGRPSGGHTYEGKGCRKFKRKRMIEAKSCH